MNESPDFFSPFLQKKERLLENETGFVIYDGFPVNEGHCLVVPHRVYSNYFDSTPEEVKGLQELVFQAKQLLDEASAGAAPGESWTCPECGTRIDGNFSECWNCAEDSGEQ